VIGFHQQSSDFVDGAFDLQQALARFFRFLPMRLRFRKAAKRMRSHNTRVKLLGPLLQRLV
jgi:hypothetical protein